MRDANAMRRVAQQNCDADAALFRRIYPDLRRFAAVWTSVEAEPDDLVQQAVSNALRRGPLSSLTDPAAYLRTAIVNVARDLNRRRGTTLSSAAPPSIGERDAYPSDLEILSRLEPEIRVLLYLIDVEGTSYQEAEGLLGTSAQVLRARASRAPDADSDERSKGRRIDDRTLRATRLVR